MAGLLLLNIWVGCAVLCFVVQSCLTLCDPMDCSPLGSSVHGFSRQEYCNGLPCPPPGDLPNPGIEPMSPALQEDSLPSEPPGLGFTFLFIYFLYIYIYIYGFLGGASGKEPTCQCRRQKRRQFNPRVRKTPRSRKGHRPPALLPVESHGQKNPVGYSP